MAKCTKSFKIKKIKPQTMDKFQYVGGSHRRPKRMSNHEAEQI